MRVRKMILSAFFIAMGVFFPILFHWIGISSFIFLPMHLPVMLCGFICGPGFGLLCGVLTPLLSSIFTGMPPLYPVATYMLFELAAYGFLCGFLLKPLEKSFKSVGVVLALVCAMLGGRIVLALAQICILGFGEKGFAFNAFLSSAFVTALPGMAVQIVVIPALILVLKNTMVVRSNH